MQGAGGERFAPVHHGRGEGGGDGGEGEEGGVGGDEVARAGAGEEGWGWRCHLSLIVRGQKD